MKPLTPKELKHLELTLARAVAAVPGQVYGPAISEFKDHARDDVLWLTALLAGETVDTPDPPAPAPKESKAKKQPLKPGVADEEARARA